MAAQATAASTAALNNFTQAQLNALLGQIVNFRDPNEPGARNFWSANQHISAADRLNFLTNILRNDWPSYPVFSPYANSKATGQYSQGTFNPIRGYV